jgi:hypothetical protein
MLAKSEFKFIILLALTLPPSFACSTGPTAGTSPAQIETNKEQLSKAMSSIELQGRLLRFQGNFSDNLRQAFHPLETSSEFAIRRDSLRNRLTYGSSALDIALGPVPETNLLDMVTFIDLGKYAFEHYWLPKVYGPAALPVLNVFTDAHRQLQDIQSRVLTLQQIETLDSVIHQWIAAHPNQFAVEGVRLSLFAAESGAQARRLKEEIGGLLSSVQRATLTADQAILLGERSLYYMQRVPFLMRLHAREATSELIDSTAQAINELPISNDELARVKSMISELRYLVLETQEVMKDGTRMTHEVQSLLDLIYKYRNLESYKVVNQIIQGLYGIIQEYHQVLASPVHSKEIDLLANTTQTLEKTANRILIKTLLGLSLLISFLVLSVLLSRMAFQIWLDSRASKKFPPSNRSTGGKAA